MDTSRCEMGVAVLLRQQVFDMGVVVLLGQ